MSISRANISSVVVLLLSPVLFTSMNVGAETKSRTKELIEEITVTATKKAGGQALQEAPLAVSAFSSEELSITKVQDIGSLGYSVPNTLFDDAGTFKGVANFSIRGFGINSSIGGVEPSVGTFVDGVYMGSNYGVITDFLDVESVEVLRGPQGLLFGRNVTGGAVLINSARPSEEFSASLKARLETGLDQTYTGVINGALTDKINGRLAVQYRDDDGWFENEFNDSNFGAMESHVARGSLSFKPNESSEYLLIVEDGSMKGDGTISQGWSVVPAYSHKVNIDNEGLTDIDWTQVTLNTSWDVALGNGTITNILAWREVKSVNDADIDSSPITVFDDTNYFDQDQVSNELRYNGTFGKFDVTSGLYYFTQDYFVIEQRRLLGGLLTQHTGGKIDHEAYGAFTQVDYRMTENFVITAGLRYSYESKDAKISPRDLGSCNLATHSCSILYKDSDNWGNFMPKLGFSWEFKEGMNFYGYYAKGYRSGGYNTRQATSKIPGVAAFPAFDEEEQDAYELGLKSLFNEGRTKLNLALFYSKIMDLQKDVVPPGTLDQISTNTADAEIQGAEVEFDHQLTDSLLISANFGYIDAKYTDVLYDLTGDGIVNSDDLDLDLTRTPKYTRGIDLTYEYNFQNNATLLTRLSYAYRDKTYQSDSNQLPLHEVEMVNLYFTYYSPDDKWSISAYGKNLLDEVIYSGNTLLPPSLPGGTFTPIGGEGEVYGVEFEYKL